MSKPETRMCDIINQIQVANTIWLNGLRKRKELEQYNYYVSMAFFFVNSIDERVEWSLT